MRAQIDDFSRSMCLTKIPAQRQNHPAGAAARRFLPPEIAAGASDVTDRVDVYSLGALMWEMCGTAFPLLRDVRDQEELEVGLSSLGCEDEWKGIVRSCVDVKPHRRPSAADVVRWLQI